MTKSKSSKPKHTVDPKDILIQYEFVQMISIRCFQATSLIPTGGA